MSTPTEAYYDLRRHVIFSDPDDGAKLIADSEANAVAAAVTALTCVHHNDLERAACPVCLVTTLTTERDQLRAEVNALVITKDKACAAAVENKAEADGLRAAIALGQQNCDDAYDDLRAERDQFRAEVERLTKSIRVDTPAMLALNEEILKANDEAIARAERAEADAERYRLVTLRKDAELVAERAQLDWVFRNCKVTSDGYPVHDREDLGVAMKEGAK